MTTTMTDLIQKLSDDDETNRREAAEDLMEHWDLGAIPHLVKAFGDPVPAVRDMAIDTLVNRSCKTTIDALIAELENELPVIRNAACEALKKIGESTTLQLTNFAYSAPRDVRLYVLDILAEIGGSIAEDFISLALEESDPNIAAAAATALAKVAGERSVSRLISALSRESWVRCAATIGLGTVGGPQAEAALACLLCDSDDQVSYLAAVAMRDFGGQKSVEPLISGLMHRNPIIAETSLDALDEVTERLSRSGSLTIANSKDTDSLRFILTSATPQKRSQTVQVLERFGVSLDESPEDENYLIVITKENNK